MQNHPKITDWVEHAPDDQVEFRQAAHTIPYAIARNNWLRQMMVFKGGMLLALRYDSERFTKDLDFSTDLKLVELDRDKLRHSLELSLLQSVDQLVYQVDCTIQKFNRSPRHLGNPTFPSVEMTIGYARFGTPAHRRLLAKRSSNIIPIDFSLNETIMEMWNLEIGTDVFVRSYALIDLVAEKFRSLLQQKERNRSRRQDVFDLFHLLQQFKGDLGDKPAIHRCLQEKSNSRGINAQKNSMSDPEIRSLASRDYETLQSELQQGRLPDFDRAYDSIIQYYESLPWEQGKLT